MYVTRGLSLPIYGTYETVYYTHLKELNNSEGCIIVLSFTNYLAYNITSDEYEYQLQQHG